MKIDHTSGMTIQASSHGLTSACAPPPVALSCVTVLFTASMTGEKKRPLMIGKKHKPRCLKNIRAYPVDYRSQNSSWMTADIYSRWLAKWDEHLRARKRQILLLHDNCSAHAVDHLVALTNIELAFLPANTTAILQPIDQGIIQMVKKGYRRLLC